MVLGLVSAIARMTVVALAGLGAFVASGRITGHLVGSVDIQVGVAVVTGLVTAVVVRKMLAISEIPRVLSSTSLR